MQESPFLEALERRRRLFRDTRRSSRVPHTAGSGSQITGYDDDDGTNGWALLAGAGDDDADGESVGRGTPSTLASSVFGSDAESKERERERVRIMANWDPGFPSERLSWYDEYIQRHGPIAVNWTQCAYDEAAGAGAGPSDFVEARGVALYYPDGPAGETVLAVSPLDDGGVCLWDVGGTRGRRGAIFARSRPGILFIDGPGADNSRRSKRIDSGVTECVSVDSRQHRAFFAVQSRKCQPNQFLNWRERRKSEALTSE